MFDKNKFANIIKNIKETYNTQEEFAKISGIGRTYLSQYMNMKLDEPPKPKILEKLANASNGISSYAELMQICGYININEKNNISVYARNDTKSRQIDFLVDLSNRRNLSPIENNAFAEIATVLMECVKGNKTFDLHSIIASDNYLYAKLQDNEKQNVLEYLQTLIAEIDFVDSQYNKKDSALVFVYGTIPAGIPMECIEDIIDTEEIDGDMLRGGKQYFGLKVKGNSMEPEYLDGDTLILIKQEDCESGDDCVVMVNGFDGTFKRVFKNENGIVLQPLNSAYAPMVYSNEDIEKLPVRIIGVVDEIRRKKRKK